MRNEWDDVAGDLFGYLGHFAQARFLRQGHNDGPAPTEVGHLIYSPAAADTGVTYSSGDRIGGTLQSGYDSSAIMQRMSRGTANDQ